MATQRYWPTRYWFGGSASINNYWEPNYWPSTTENIIEPIIGPYELASTGAHRRRAEE